MQTSPNTRRSPSRSPTAPNSTTHATTEAQSPMVSASCTRPTKTVMNTLFSNRSERAPMELSTRLSITHWETLWPSRDSQSNDPAIHVDNLSTLILSRWNLRSTRCSHTTTSSSTSLMSLPTVNSQSYSSQFLFLPPSSLLLDPFFARFS